MLYFLRIVPLHSALGSYKKDEHGTAEAKEDDRFTSELLFEIMFLIRRIGVLHVCLTFLYHSSHPLDRLRMDPRLPTLSRNQDRRRDSSWQQS